jgi:hypothetical protein
VVGFIVRQGLDTFDAKRAVEATPPA